METDRNGNFLGEYPRTCNSAILLGINGEGIAEYFDDPDVLFAELTESGDLDIPPGGFGRVHELSLEAFEWTLPEYLDRSTQEKGEWRALSDYARTVLLAE